MRILTLANTPLDPRSGSGYVVTGYAEGLRRRGHVVELLGPPDYEPFFGATRGIRYRQAAGMLWAAARRVRRVAYDVVEIYGGEGWLAALWLTRLSRRRFLVVQHSNGLETHARERLHAAARQGRLPRSGRHDAALSFLIARGFRVVDGVVTVGAFDAEYARTRGYGGGNVIAIENPLPAAYLGRPFVAEREARIGFVGAWLPRKGSARIARDLPGVLRAFPGSRLVLVGVGEGFVVADHFPSDVLPRIEVVPSADRSQLLQAHYPRFSVALLPSAYESFGLVATEAMACGAALVASPVGFAHGLRDGEEALLLSEAGSPSLGDAVQRLLADESLRRAIARAGHARVQSLSWETAVPALEGAYENWRAARRQPADEGRVA